MRFKILLFFLTLAFLGGTLLAAWWFYENIDRPERRADARLRQRQQAAATGNLPDPSHPSFVKAVESLTAGDIDSAHAQLSRMLDIYRDSPHAAEARRIIGEINMDRLFSRNPMPGKRDYVVKRGDSLLRIEKGSLTTIPFLRALNKLSSTVLQPGDRLVYQPLEFEIEVDVGRKLLTLFRKSAGSDARQFFKEYPILAVALAPGTRKVVITQIHEKAAWLGDKRIGSTDPKYAYARKWLQTTSRPARPGILLRPVSENIAPAPDDEDAKPAYGVFLDDGDIEELNTIVRPGTPLVLRQ